jgi:lysophospholipid acyltransferase (LPLAT)-like uncharacterized protein
MGKRKKEKGDRLWYRATLFVLPRLVDWYFRLVDITSRKIFLNQHIEDEVCHRRSFTCACFHGVMLFPVYYCRTYKGVAMVSRSFDGDLIDRCIRRWGYITTRGSSSRGGKEALEELVDVVKEKDCASGLAVDAPRGPSRKVKIGTVMVGKATGQPVVPLMSWTTRHIQFNSWDRMILPLPFSTIVLAFGTPTEVPPDLDREGYERLRQEVEDKMLEAQEQAEQKVAELKGSGR